jgi:hypothetical protein
MSEPVDMGLFGYVAVASQLSLGGVLLLSVLPKLRHPVPFAQSVIAYDILPDRVSSAFAMVLIPLEVFLAIAFVTDWLTHIALPLATAMLMVFLVAVGITLHRGNKIPCGCFGDAGERISVRTLVRLLLLLTMALSLTIFRAVSDTPFPNLRSAFTDVSTLTYLLQSTLLAVFLTMLGIWILNLPEAIYVIRQLLWSGLSERRKDA